MNEHGIEIIGEGVVTVGERTTIAPGCKVIFHKPAQLTIGDYCSIGSGVKFIVDGAPIGIDDWTTLHDNCLVLSGEGVEIGQHGWFGQNAVLDGTGRLTIGNGVRVGMYSQIWSHVAAGERIEGCTLYGKRPVVLDDHVWLVGTCYCGSGVTLGKRTIALLGSNITRSWGPDLVLSGAPAKPREGLSFYKDVTLDDKWTLLTGWMHDLQQELDLKPLSTRPDAMLAYVRDDRPDEVIAFVKETALEEEAGRLFDRATICTLETKTYRKRLTGIEQKVLKALSGNQARFLRP